MATPANYLDEQIRSQQAQHASVTDTHQWLTRYIFSPFKDCGLSLKLQGDFGIVGAIKAGYIIPITRRQQWIMDYGEVKNVPTYADGSYHPSSLGVSTMKPTDRAPSRVVEAIFRIFNAYHDTGQNEDNGICEIEALRGSDDMELLREVNDFCLPKVDGETGEAITYSAASQQIAQLKKAISSAPTLLHRSVAEQLVAATLQSVVWAKWHYAGLKADMEDKARTGKDRLSPLDAAVCRWLERPEPQYRSNLAGEAQPVVIQQGQTVATPAPRPTVQCESCGGISNLLANGQRPKFCGVCREPFGSEAVVKEAATELVIETERPKRGRPAKAEEVKNDPLI